MLKVYKKIKELRLARGWSQDKLATSISTSLNASLSKMLTSSNQ